MGNVRFSMKKSAVNQILKGEATRALLAEYSANVRRRAGSEFGDSTRMGKDRVRGYVGAWSTAAKRKQAREHSLERAVGGGK